MLENCNIHKLIYHSIDSCQIVRTWNLKYSKQDLGASSILKIPLLLKCWSLGPNLQLCLLQKGENFSAKPITTLIKFSNIFVTSKRPLLPASYFNDVIFSVVWICGAFLIWLTKWDENLQQLFCIDRLPSTWLHPKHFI